MENSPHDRWMALALELAEKGRGRVEPNPRVGCVLVRDGVEIGEGWHTHWGGPHAERAALADAAWRVKADATLVPGIAEGCTAYVTLEPCGHQGKTPPCTEALIHAGVRRVVAAIEDPNPQVRGTGFRRLREAGIEVVIGPGAARADRLNRGFLHFHRRGRPYGLAKWAMTLDGKIADASRRSKWITGEESRAHARGLRRECDAILVGVGTVLADDPSLRREQARGKAPSDDPGVSSDGAARPPTSEDIDAIIEDVNRLTSGRTEVEQRLAEAGQILDNMSESLDRLFPSVQVPPPAPPEPPPPRPYRRIILDTHARTPPTAKCVADARQVETWIVISDAKRNAAVRALTDAGCRVIAMPPDARGRIDLAWLWQELGTRGVQQVLIEGGGEVLASAFAAGIVNEVAVYIAPLLLGGRDAVPAVGGAGFTLPGAPRITEVRWEQVGEDLCGRGMVAVP